MSTVIVCASNDVKTMIMASVQESKMSDEIKNAIYGELENIPSCTGLLPVDFENMKAGGKGGAKKKRAKSGYNVWIGECMLGKDVKSFAEAGGKMKECAAEWKEGGPKLKEEYDKKAELIKSGVGTA